MPETHRLEATELQCQNMAKRSTDPLINRWPTLPSEFFKCHISMT